MIRITALTRITALLVLSLFAAMLISPAMAQYPNRPIRLIVPAGPGGMIGSDVVAKATPDGYTLLMCYVSHATNPTLNKTLPYDTLRDFMPITLMSHEPTLLVTSNEKHFRRVEGLKVENWT